MAALVPETKERATCSCSWQDQVVPKLPDTNGKRELKPTIFLVRHGDYCQDPQLGQHLTPSGKAQAHRAGQSFREYVQNILPTKLKVYHSNLPRSVETAEIIMSYLSACSLQSPSTSCTCNVEFDVVCSHLLREISFNPAGTEPVFKVDKLY